MIVTFFRSSSYNAWDMCPFSYYLVYGLGIRDPGKKKTHKGSITHKALELLAQQKLAKQNNENTFYNDELDKTWDVNSFDSEAAHEEGWKHYTAKYEDFDWNDQDWKDCRQWMQHALTFRDGMFSPEKRTIVKPEQYFDFAIEEPWAYYSYTTNDCKGKPQKIDGQLGLKGTMDLLAEVDGMPGVFELIDWKTGLRLDWATGAVKDYNKLRKDAQLRLYHYALHRLYPDMDEVVITIFFLQHKPNSKKPEEHGGPFSVHFSKADLKETERIIENRFNVIKNCYRPKQRKTWRCKAFCHFGKNNQPGSNKTICDFMGDELVQLGMDKCIEKHGNLNSILTYGEGGGRTHEKE